LQSKHLVILKFHFWQTWLFRRTRTFKNILSNAGEKWIKLSLKSHCHSDFSDIYEKFGWVL